MDVMAGRTGLSLEWLVLGQLFDEQRRGQQFAEEQKKEEMEESGHGKEVRGEVQKRFRRESGMWRRRRRG